MQINLSPFPEEVKSFGLLAHIEPAERKKIMALPKVQQVFAMTTLKREINNARKKSDRGVNKATTYRDLTEMEKSYISKLHQVTFLPASPDKSFFNNIKNATKITEKQAEYLIRIVHRYRRQIA